METRPKASIVLFAKSVPKLANFCHAFAGMAVAHQDKDRTVLDQESFHVVVLAIPKSISPRIHSAEPLQVRDSAA